MAFSIQLGFDFYFSPKRFTISATGPATIHFRVNNTDLSYQVNSGKFIQFDFKAGKVYKFETYTGDPSVENVPASDNVQLVSIDKPSFAVSNVYFTLGPPLDFCTQRIPYFRTDDNTLKKSFRLLQASAHFTDKIVNTPVFSAYSMQRQNVAVKDLPRFTILFVSYGSVVTADGQHLSFLPYLESQASPFNYIPPVYPIIKIGDTCYFYAKKDTQIVYISGLIHSLYSFSDLEPSYAKSFVESLLILTNAS